MGKFIAGVVVGTTAAAIAALSAFFVLDAETRRVELNIDRQVRAITGAANRSGRSWWRA